MDIETIYQARNLVRESLPDDILGIISKLKISFRPSFRRPFQRRREPEAANWRENTLVDFVRKVREKDDPDYDAVSACINKLTKSNFAKIMEEIFTVMEKKDTHFRLRVTTLLFDRGIRQTFFAPIMADVYVEIMKAYPDARDDLATQITLFDKLYDVANVVVVPSGTGEEFNNAIIAWTKQKELKRGFAVYVGELYSRNLITDETMNGFVRTVVDDLKESIRLAKNPATEEHVDALVRFLFAVATKVPLKTMLQELLAIPRPEVPSLTMKSRFKLEDAAKASR